MNIKCFLIEDTGHHYLSLRRYRSSSKGDKCPVHGYHTAQVPLDVMGSHEIGGFVDTAMDDSYKEIYKDNFPKKCDCGYEFTEEDMYQIFKETQYKDAKGNAYTLPTAPVGAIWRAWWYEEVKDMRGPDGKCYVCKTPGGDWVIDSRASNCTRRDDSEHKCWCRHGEAPNFTVNKVGNTCAAGAGSILIGNYHGFLINGELTSC